MAYTGITRLRLNMDTGETQEGSGEVVSARAPEGTSFGGYSAQDLAGVKPYPKYDDFIEDTKSEKYKGNWKNAREAEAFREECAKRLAAMDMVALSGRVQSEPVDTAAAIVQADPSINPALARAGVKDGPFISREQRQAHYSDPRYSQSEDFRSYVASRDAITEF